MIEHLGALPPPDTQQGKLDMAAAAFKNASDGFAEEIEKSDPERRPHLEATLAALVENKAPASSSPTRHGCFDGGLTVHSWMLYLVAKEICAGGLLNLVWGLSQKYGPPVTPVAEEMIASFACLNQNSVLTAALLHDLNKLRDLYGNPVYVPKLLKEGQRSEKVPWTKSDVSKDPLAKVAQMIPDTWASVLDFASCAIQVRDGVVSLAVAEQISPGILATLSTEEVDAVLFHDGAYVGKSGLTGRENPLQQVTHFADMISSRWLS